METCAFHRNDIHFQSFICFLMLFLHTNVKVHTGCFLTGPTQKSFKYGTGAPQRKKSTPRHKR